MPIYTVTIRFGEFSSSGFSCDSMSEAIERLFESATYYCPRHKNVSFEITMQCATCGGTGETVSQRSGRTVKKIRCKECKGKNSEQQIASGPLNPSNHVAIVDPHEIDATSNTLATMAENHAKEYGQATVDPYWQSHNAKYRDRCLQVAETYRQLRSVPYVTID